MVDQKVCKECGAPKLIYKGLTWKENGIIVEKKDPDHRMFFAESDNIEALFAGIEDLIGMSIDKFVVESKRRLSREYLENMLPPSLLKLLYWVKPDIISKKMDAIAKAYGYGKTELVDLRMHTREGDYLAVSIEHPYSLRFYRGDNLGGMEAGTGRECTSSVKEISEDKYLLEMWVGNHPSELEEHLKPPTYSEKAGNVELERCPSCGVPLAVAEHDFNMDAGIITHPMNGTRMAFFGPAGLDSVFLDLEDKLGLSIAETVIEAQKRYWKRAPSADIWAVGGNDLKRMIAIRGYGILSEYETGREHLSLTIQNATAIYTMVGMVQGLFESVRKLDSSIHEWSVSDSGDLSIRISKA